MNRTNRTNKPLLFFLSSLCLERTHAIISVCVLNSKTRDKAGNKKEPFFLKRTNQMKRPELNEIPLNQVLEALLDGKPSINVTMSEGQWDGFLQSAYETGHSLIEVNDSEIPVRAYRRKLDG
jgi:hypothetical protein